MRGPLGTPLTRGLPLLLRLARAHLILWLGALPLLAMAGSTFHSFGYDDGAVGSALFLISATFGAPFHWAAELMGGDRVQGPTWIWFPALVLGFIPYILADRLLIRVAEWREQFHSKAGA